jgi:tetratricopeptide (TPR) repeat protein
MRLAPVLVLAVLPHLALADILHMADGTTREGKVIATTDEKVIVDFGHGSMSLRVSLPREEVLRIEPKQTPNDALTVEYVRRLAKALNGTADDWHALGNWCTRQRVLKDKAAEAYERALALDPNHAGARRAIGHVKLDDTWMTREQAIHLLAPDLAAGANRAAELALEKQLEEAKTELLEAQKQVKDLQAKVAELDRKNDEYRERLAVPPPPPPPPRVIYRPIIIFRDRDKDAPPGKKK